MQISGKKQRKISQGLSAKAETTGGLPGNSAKPSPPTWGGTSSHYAPPQDPQHDASAAPSPTTQHVYTKEQLVVHLRPGMLILKGVLSSSEQQLLVDMALQAGKSTDAQTDGGEASYAVAPANRKGEEDSGVSYNTPSTVSGFYAANSDGSMRLNQGTRGRVTVPLSTLPDFVTSMCLSWVNIARLHDDKIPPMRPTICLMNYYNHNGSLNLHVDNAHAGDADLKTGHGPPVVSVTIGDSCEFVYKETFATPSLEKVLLESGDILLFGGPSRMVVHGVTKIIPAGRPVGVSMPPGRLNITLRDVQGAGVDASLLPKWYGDAK